jgi:D-amino-acid oxidase
MKPAKPIAVIGSGVIGLTSAISLVKAGYRVTIYAREQPPHTTSDVAAAYWAPDAAWSGGRMRQWALASLETFSTLVSDPASGIRLNWLYELAEEEFAPPHGALPLAVEEVPLGRFPPPWSGLKLRTVQIDVPVYMPWLYRRFLALGGTVTPATITGWDELTGNHALIVNCTGLGAQALTGDELFPIRGQVIRIHPPAGLPTEMVYAEARNEVTYIIPRSQDCLLGGTYHYGDSRRAVDEQIAAGILARCAQFYPDLRQPQIIEHRVGLRPGRRAVRLESEQLANGVTAIHNYGHAALGHTLSWGCAAEVVRLAQQASRQ